jgi:hypothetical protein
VAKVPTRRGGGNDLVTVRVLDVFQIDGEPFVEVEWGLQRTREDNSNCVVVRFSESVHSPRFLHAQRLQYAVFVATVRGRPKTVGGLTFYEPSRLLESLDILME